MSDDHAHCSVCGDDAVEARVLALRDDGTVRAVTDSGELVVAIDLLDTVRPGDMLLVHQGFAIARVPREPGS